PPVPLAFLRYENAMVCVPAVTGMLNERHPVSVPVAATSPRFPAPPPALQLVPMSRSPPSMKKCRQSASGSELTRALKVMVPAPKLPLCSMRAACELPMAFERSAQRPSAAVDESTDQPAFALAGFDHPAGIAQFNGKASGSEIVTVALEGFPSEAPPVGFESVSMKVSLPSP